MDSKIDLLEVRADSASGAEQEALNKRLDGLINDSDEMHKVEGEMEFFLILSLRFGYVII